jgi:hypothetical protein
VQKNSEKDWQKDGGQKNKNTSKRSLVSSVVLFFCPKSFCQAGPTRRRYLASSIFLPVQGLIFLPPHFFARILSESFCTYGKAKQ